MTAVYDVLIRGSNEFPIGLYQLQLATAEQLCRLHYSMGSLKAIKARLKDLVDAGYVQADTVPTKRYRSSYFYLLTDKGLKYMVSMGADVTQEASRLSSDGSKHTLFMEHSLELNDVLICAFLLMKVDQRYFLEEFIHERTLKKRPYRTRVKQRTFTIIPDALLDLRVQIDDGRTAQFPALLEHDRGTEGQQYFKRRIRAYIELLKAGPNRDIYAGEAITIAFTTFVGPKRLEQMRLWTREELEDAHQPEMFGLSFYFAHLERPLDPVQVWLEPIWHSAYEDGMNPKVFLDL